MKWREIVTYDTATSPFFVCYLAMWGVFFVFVLRWRSPFPRWLTFFSPALVSLLITILYASHVFPLLGNLLYPAVLSFPHLIFYSLITVLLWKRPQLEDSGDLVGMQ